MSVLIKKSISALIVMAFVLGAFMPFVPTVTAQNDPPNGGGTIHWGGDWAVEDQRTYDGGTELVMDSGSVTVKNGGTLTLDHAGLNFASGSYGKFGIVVEKGGTFIMKNGAYLDTWVPANGYYCGFLAGSTVTLDGSTIFHTGGIVPGSISGWTTGVLVESKNVTMDNMNFGKGYGNNPLVNVMNGGHLIVRNSTFYVQPGFGFDVEAGSVLDFYDSSISGGANAMIGIYVNTDAKANLVKADISTMLNNGIYVFAGDLDMRESIIHHNPGAGVSVNHNTVANFVNNTIDKNQNGIWISEHTQVTLTGKNSINSNSDHGIFADMYSKVTSTGTTITQSTNENVALSMGSELIFNKGSMVANPFNNNVFAVNGAHVVIRSSDMNGGGNGMGNANVMAESSTSVELYKNKMYHSSFQVMGMWNTSLISEDNSFSDGSLGYGGQGPGTFVSRRNTFETMFAFASINFNMNLLSEDDKVTFGDWANVVYSSDYSSVEIKRMTGSLGNHATYGYASTYGEIKFVDTKLAIPTVLPDPMLIADGAGAHFILINTTPFKLDQAFALNGGIIDMGWHAVVQTQWQNGAVAPSAQVSINDTNGKQTHKFVTNTDGKKLIDILEITNTSLGIIKHNIYKLSADLNGMKGNLNTTISGNRLGPNAIIVKITDTSAPFASITSPVNGLITNAHAIDISGLVLDNGSGIEKVQAKVGTGNWVDIPNWTAGIFLLEDYGLDLDGDDQVSSIYVVDRSGLNYTAQVTISVDWTLPPIVVAEPAGNYVKTSQFFVNGTTDPVATLKIDGTAVTVASDGKFSKSYDKQDGTYNISLEAVDLAGNVMKTNKIVTVDTVAPVITTNVADQAYTAFPGLRLRGTLTDANTPLELTVNGKNATVDQVNKTWYIDLTLVEGPNNVSIIAKDPALNIGTKNMVINLDTVAPVISVTSPKGPYPVYTNNATQTISGTVVEKNLKSFTVNGKNVTVVNGTFSTVVTLVAGSNHVNLTAQDFCADSFFDVFIEVSFTAPTIVINSPVNGFVTKSATVAVDVSVTSQDPAPNVTLMRIRMRNDQPVRYSGNATLDLGQNTLRVNATDRYGNTATATVSVVYDNVALLTLTKPTKTKISTSTPSVTISGTSEPGAKIYINDVMIPSNADGTFTYKMLVKEGKTTIVVKAIDPAGNPVTKTITATRTEAKQFEMTALLGLGIVLMIIGLIIGVVVGKVISKPKSKLPVEEEEVVAKAPTKTKPAPVEEPEEDKPFTAEPEEEEPAPVEKGSLKDKQKDAEAKPTETDTKPKAQPKPEPKPEPKAAPKPEPKKPQDDSLEDLLKGLEKKK